MSPGGGSGGLLPLSLIPILGTRLLPLGLKPEVLAQGPLDFLHAQRAVRFVHLKGIAHLAARLRLDHRCLDLQRHRVQRPRDVVQKTVPIRATDVDRVLLRSLGLDLGNRDLDGFRSRVARVGAFLVLAYALLTREALRPPPRHTPQLPHANAHLAPLGALLPPLPVQGHSNERDSVPEHHVLRPLARVVCVCLVPGGLPVARHELPQLVDQRVDTVPSLLLRDRMADLSLGAAVTLLVRLVRLPGQELVRDALGALHGATALGSRLRGGLGRGDRAVGLGGGGGGVRRRTPGARSRVRGRRGRRPGGRHWVRRRRNGRRVVPVPHVLPLGLVLLPGRGAHSNLVRRVVRVRVSVARRALRVVGRLGVVAQVVEPALELRHTARAVGLKVVQGRLQLVVRKGKDRGPIRLLAKPPGVTVAFGCCRGVGPAVRAHLDVETQPSAPGVCSCVCVVFPPRGALLQRSLRQKERKSRTGGRSVGRSRSRRRKNPRPRGHPSKDPPTLSLSSRNLRGGSRRQSVPFVLSPLCSSLT
mmetsp:Transcript_6528/g.23455  ORF Transcript_6528/g.23455 Transcript_6528/m.23455 type:complete len:531 (+) Transcript_6528:76-1668(+)